jgi:hypothetical protein
MRLPIWYQSAQTLANDRGEPTYIVTRRYEGEQESVILFERELTSTDYLNIEHGFLPCAATGAV